MPLAHFTRHCTRWQIQFFFGGADKCAWGLVLKLYNTKTLIPILYKEERIYNDNYRRIKKR